jgi:hypothetical protein
MNTVRNNLPTFDRVGAHGVWELPDDAGAVTVAGVFLGASTSRRKVHTRHAGPYAARGERCAACRWSEFRIFRRDRGGYIVHTVGGSAVPGEVDGYRPCARVALTPPEVLEILTTRLKPAPGRPVSERAVFFSDAAARVLAQASAFDEPLEDAWENRRVA